MKRLTILALLCAAASCAIQEQPANEMSPEAPLTLKSLLSPSTRSSAGDADSAFVRSCIQSDKDLFMLNRVVFRDSVYVLSLKEDDALFLGISREMYGRYVDYVNALNEQMSDQK